MSRLRIRTVADPELQSVERGLAFMRLSAGEKIERLFQLIAFSALLRNGAPLKEPQGSGIVIRKPEGHGPDV